MKCYLCGSNKLRLVAKNTVFKEVGIFICHDCHLIQVAPKANIKNSSLDRYYRTIFIKKFERNINKRFIREKEGAAKSRFDFIESSGIFYKNSKILEIGCGTGALLNMFKDKGAQVFGIEPNIEAAEYAKKNYGLNILTDSFNEGSFTGEEFDIICLSHVLEHMKDTINFLYLVKRRLRNKGKVFIEVPNDDVERLKLNEKLGIKTPHLFFYSPGTFLRVMARAGLRAEKIYTYGMSLERFKQGLTSKSFVNFSRRIINKIMYKENIIGKTIRFFVNCLFSRELYSAKGKNSRYYNINTKNQGIAIRAICSPFK